MGAEEKKEDSESSGLADILEIAAELGTDDDEPSGPNAITRPIDESDELEDVSAGYGGMAAAALVPGANDADAPVAVEAANTPAASAGDELDSSSEPDKAPSKSPAPVAAPEPKPSRKPEPTRSQSPAEPEPEPERVAVTPAAASEPAREQKSGNAVWLLMAGAAALAGIVWFATQNGDAPERSEPAPAAAARPEPNPEPEPPEPPPAADEHKLAMADQEQAEDEQAVADTDPTDDEEDVVEIEDDEAEPEPEPEPESEVVASARRGKRRAKSDNDKPKPEPKAEPEPEPPPAPEPEPEPEPEPASPPADDGKFSSECLLNPNKPGCAEFNEKRKKKTTDLDATLPDKLTHTQIRQGITPVKSKAKACGAKHGAEPGTKVRVKLSIEGDTGKVVSASAMSPHDSDPVGQCVADALKEATFPRFKSGQQGTVYPVTL